MKIYPSFLAASLLLWVTGCGSTQPLVSGPAPVAPAVLTAQRASTPAAPATAPQRFPADWSGTWKGSCQSVSPGKTNDPFNMNLTVKPLPNKPTAWTWIIEYSGKNLSQTRSYEMQQQNARQGHYVVDEKNGIFLDTFWVGERTLLEQFAVGDSNLTVKHRLLDNNQMEVEFMIFGRTTIRDSAAGTNEVQSYGLQTYQQCLLKR